ncbi:MIP/aquaporin family protein [Anaerospora hongkongensis]|uniref:MIP/aquaporin family protein n=1 Tax=Anaerospora hongkongensis TaxID=244830 RepID=UPI00289C1A90|nr:MIP/aquaporin family protein [Anaerospora hongkongensis]
MTSPLMGEFLGTAVLIVFGNGVVASCLLKKSKAEGAGWVAITAGWAFAVIMGVFTANALGSVQADLNPAVTLAKAIGGVYTSSQAIGTIVAEIAGAFVGACIVWLFFMDHWSATEDKGLKLACFSTGPAIRNATNNLISEIIGTFMLVFVIFCIFSKAVGGVAAGFGPYLVGVLVWAIGLSLGATTGYAINPARDLGPRLAHAFLPVAGKGDSDWSYAWIPVVGPFIGGALAAFAAIMLGLL